MKLLIVSDTHVPARARDLPAALWRAVDAADLVVHAGDWVDVRLLDTLAARAPALLGVYGPSAGGHGDYQVIIAAMVIATIPLIILFFVGQKYFIEQGGIATQGRKG